MVQSRPSWILSAGTSETSSFIGLHLVHFLTINCPERQYTEEANGCHTVQEPLLPYRQRGTNYGIRGHGQPGDNQEADVARLSIRKQETRQTTKGLRPPPEKKTPRTPEKK